MSLIGKLGFKRRVSLEKQATEHRAAAKSQLNTDRKGPELSVRKILPSR